MELEKLWPPPSAGFLSGRELRVVVNTNDPDYEHIYSIENYDDPLDELLYFATPATLSDGNVGCTVCVRVHADGVLILLILRIKTVIWIYTIEN